MVLAPFLFACVDIVMFGFLIFSTATFTHFYIRLRNYSAKDFLHFNVLREVILGFWS